jgi:hypothetical protein
VSLAAQGCGHGDGEDDDLEVMPDHDDDGAQEPTLGACHGGGPTLTCGGGYHRAEDPERVSAAQY